MFRISFVNPSYILRVSITSVGRDFVYARHNPGKFGSALAYYKMRVGVGEDWVVERMGLVKFFCVFLLDLSDFFCIFAVDYAWCINLLITNH